jgi:hypothetical protein
MRPALATSLAASFLITLGGCEPRERIVRYKPFLAGLENVETQTPTVEEHRPIAVADEGGSLAENNLEIENPDGTKTLISRSGVQLMAQIRRLLAEEEVDLFTEQVLSELTREEYRARGLDPKEAFKTLKEREKDILLLFNRMPMGEHTPSAVMEPIGKNFFRVRITGDARKGLGRYTGFDMILEKGNWKLRWFH